MKQILSKFSVLFFLLMLPGCGHLIDWGTGNFCQGIALCDLTIIPKLYVRTTTIYDQVRTRATFSTLWLAPEVVKTSCQINARQSNAPQETIEHQCMQHTLETFNTVSFYVLATHVTKLDKPDSSWRLFLKVDGATLVPASIQKIDLSPTYKAFFGKAGNSFRLAYHVRFSLVDAHGHQSVSLDHARCMQLFFRTVDKETSVRWDVQEQHHSFCTTQENCVDSSNYREKATCNAPCDSAGCS